MHRYACADWHGRFDVYQEVKRFLEPNDIVYFIGDAIDRGPDSLKLAMAIYNDPQFMYLKGNHEDMMVKALKKDMAHRDLDTNRYSQEEVFLIWTECNGGYPTLEEFSQLPLEDRLDWIEKFNNLPHQILIKDSKIGWPIYLVHSGDLEDEMWSRHHFHESPTVYLIIHGHTPVPLLKNYLPITEEMLNDTACWYANNSKVDIDLGTVWTGRTVLLDIDTLDEHYFDLGEITNE